MTAVLLLQALGHTEPAAALADAASQGRLVSWLEDTKIRALPIGEREPLRSVEEAGWEAAFGEYCARVGCPAPPPPPAAPLAAAVSWLLAHAVGLEYHDQAARLAPSAAGAAGDAAALQQLSLDEQTLRGVESAEFWAAMDEASDALRLHRRGTASGEAGARVGDALSLAAASARLAWLAAVPPDERERVASAAAAAADAPGAFPLGFEVADPALERPASLLRARHVAALRTLQSRADAALVAAQECTADPKTDTRRGRVGR